MQQDQPLGSHASSHRDTGVSRWGMNVQDIPVGAKLAVKGGATVEVIDNPRDGTWVIARFLSCPDDPSREGSEDMVFRTDIVDLVEMP